MFVEDILDEEGRIGRGRAVDHLSVPITESIVRWMRRDEAGQIKELGVEGSRR